MNGPLVLKLGGELLESAADRARIAAAAGAIALRRPLVIVHGGGRAIDAELDRRGIAPKKVDGLRVTDRATLDAVVSVLGGTSNTELVAALVGQGVPAVGLTGVDAGLGRAARANAHRSTSGAVVDLGFVGDPAEIDVSLVELLLVHGYVPVIASLGLETGDHTGASEAPALLNVNADVMACRIAARARGQRPRHRRRDARRARRPRRVDSGARCRRRSTPPSPAGTATAGMVAKLTACRAALLEGVASIRIVDGRQFDLTHGIDEAPGTTVTLQDVAAVTTATTSTAHRRARA